MGENLSQKNCVSAKMYHMWRQCQYKNDRDHENSVWFKPSGILGNFHFYFR